MNVVYQTVRTRKTQQLLPVERPGPQTRGLCDVPVQQKFQYTTKECETQGYIVHLYTTHYWNERRTKDRLVPVPPYTTKICRKCKDGLLTCTEVKKTRHVVSFKTSSMLLSVPVQNSLLVVIRIVSYHDRAHD